MTNKLNFSAIENYSKEYATKLCDEFFSRNEVITGKKILNLSNINQVNLFSIKQLSEKWQAEMARIQSPFFDYSNEEVQKNLNNLMNVLSQNIAVKREHFEPIIEKSTKDTLLLLLNPIGFFEDIFRNFDNFTITPKDLKNVEKFVQINKAIPATVSERIKEMGLEFIYVNAALQWLEETPSSIHEQSERYLSLFSEKIPVTIQDLLFTESTRSKPIIEIREAESVSFFESIQTPEQTLPVKVIAAPVLETPTLKEVQNKIILAIAPTPIEPPKEEAKPAVFVVEQPRSFTFEPLPSVDLSLNDKFQAATNLNDVSKASETLHDQQSKSKIEGISSVISLNQKFLFINRLFGSNFDAYQHAIDELELCKDFFEAKELMLKKYVTKFNWDITSNEAEEFFEILKRRFH